MIPVQQTTFGSPNGNCFAAAVASVLEVPLEAIPDLTAGNLHQVIALNEWLAQFDLQFAWVPWATYLGRTPAFFLASGTSPRGLKHSVVCNERGDIVHDPHPSGAGIRDPEHCGIFFALKPGALIRLSPPPV